MIDYWPVLDGNDTMTLATVPTAGLWFDLDTKDTVRIGSGLEYDLVGYLDAQDTLYFLTLLAGIITEAKLVHMLELDGEVRNDLEMTPETRDMLRMKAKLQEW